MADANRRSLSKGVGENIAKGVVERCGAPADVSVREELRPSWVRRLEWNDPLLLPDEEPEPEPELWELPEKLPLEPLECEPPLEPELLEPELLECEPPLELEELPLELEELPPLLELEPPELELL